MRRRKIPRRLRPSAAKPGRRPARQAQPAKRRGIFLRRLPHSLKLSAALYSAYIIKHFKSNKISACIKKRPVNIHGAFYISLLFYFLLPFNFLQTGTEAIPAAISAHSIIQSTRLPLSPVPPELSIICKLAIASNMAWAILSTSA